MRPERFERTLVAAARTIPGVTAATFAEAGHAKHPNGVSLTAGGKISRWQVVATSASGDRFDQPEADPVLGDRPDPPETAAAQEGTPAHLEAALAIALLAADPGEIASVDLYSRRAEPPKIGHGLTITFHDGSKVFLNHV